MARAAKGDSACYIEVVGGKTDYPAGLAAAHDRLEALYADV
jgi:indolepyruvate decarboxylase